jgi:dipeptidase
LNGDLIFHSILIFQLFLFLSKSTPSMKKFNNLKIPFLIVFILLITSQLFTQTFGEKNFNCFSVLIGKNATTDGSNMFAHNEDDWGKRVVNWYLAPYEYYGQGDSITLKRGGKIAQGKETYKYLWLEIPELEFSDSYMNEFGIVIASDACVSREDKPELTDGGIGYWLRRAMAERARTAKEAVKIGGRLIDQMGYASSGRTYCIAGPNEIWMLSAIMGKHWIAQRIPDDHVAIIPNYYTISNVDLSDTVNFLGSGDIVAYAIERGWYKPKTDGGFNFRKAYSDQGNLTSLGNRARHWISINALSEKQYGIKDNLPFSFVPKKKVGLEDIFQVLRNHYEGTELDKTDGYNKGNPHQQGAMSVCSSTNQYGFVAQLRSWLPVEFGTVLWIAPRRPCTEAFVPVYSGILSIPNNFAVTDFRNGLKTHFEEIENFEQYSKGQEYLGFGEKAARIDENYGELIPQIKQSTDLFEKELLSGQPAFEKKIMNAYNKEPEQAKEMLTEYSLNAIQHLLDLAK